MIRNVIESNSACLCQQMALESKEGVSLLERVCEQFSEADRAKREKKEQKKLKKKARKKNKSSSPPDTAKTNHRSQVIQEVEDRVVTPERSKESICQVSYLGRP